MFKAFVVMQHAMALVGFFISLCFLPPSALVLTELGALVCARIPAVCDKGSISVDLSKSSIITAGVVVIMLGFPISCFDYGPVSDQDARARFVFHAGSWLEATSTGGRSHGISYHSYCGWSRHDCCLSHQGLDRDEYSFSGPEGAGRLLASEFCLVN
jgi:hypothetical protein